MDFLTVDDVMERRGITRQQAYALIREWNEDFSLAGIAIEKGKIDKKLFVYREFCEERLNALNRCKRIDFTEAACDSDGKAISGTERKLTCLYNETVISTRQVKTLINHGKADFDSRVIVVDRERADSLLESGRKYRPHGEDDMETEGRKR